MKMSDIMKHNELSTTMNGDTSAMAGDVPSTTAGDGVQASGRDSFSALIAVAVGAVPPSETSAAPGSATCAARLFAEADGDGWIADAAVRVERQVMFEIARRSIERARRRVRLGVIFCGMGFVMAMAGALAALAAWSPMVLPDLGRVSWFGRVREWLSGALGGTVEALSASAFVERWGLALLAALGALGIAGLFYIMNRAFYDDCAAD